MKQQNIQKMGKNLIISGLNKCIPLKQEHFHALVELSKVHRIRLEIEPVYFPSKIRVTVSGCCKTTNKYLIQKQLRKEERERGEEEEGRERKRVRKREMCRYIWVGF